MVNLGNFFSILIIGVLFWSSSIRADECFEQIKFKIADQEKSNRIASLKKKAIKQIARNQKIIDFTECLKHINSVDFIVKAYTTPPKTEFEKAFFGLLTYGDIYYDPVNRVIMAIPLPDCTNYVTLYLEVEEHLYEVTIFE